MKIEVPGLMLRTAREWAGLTQDQIGAKLKVDRSVVAKLEKVAAIPLHYIPQLDKVFGGEEWRKPQSRVAEAVAEYGDPSIDRLNARMDALEKLIGELAKELKALKKRGSLQEHGNPEIQEGRS